LIHTGIYSCLPIKGAKYEIYLDLGIGLNLEGKFMIEPKILDDLARKLASAVPAGLQDFQKDVEKNFRAVLNSAFTKLDLVTREEFDIQQAVLARTRMKLEILETQVAELEAQAGFKKELQRPPEGQE
jgi:BMFP domain-containing protein YqiC